MPPPLDSPLVSILIPTHNRPDYFRKTLESVLAQTYKNLEIIVSDDSQDDRTETLIRTEVHDARVTYVHHKNFRMPQNITWLLSQFHGEYFQVLMDDDLIAPTKIETMVTLYEQNPSVMLITSHRQCIDGDGQSIHGNAATRPLADRPTRFPGKTITNFLLTHQLNRIGEPSTVLLRRACQPKMLEIWQTYHANADIVTWLYLCEHGDVIYLPQTLNYFRIHGGQDQKNHHIIFEGYCEWCHIYLHAIEQTADPSQQKKYWVKYFSNLCSLVTQTLPQLRAEIFADGETFTANEQWLALEGAIHQIERRAQDILFHVKSKIDTTPF